MTITLDSLADFALPAARRVAWGGETVRFGAAAQAAMRAGRTRLMRLLDDPEVVIYGVTSGYGQFARKRLSPEERKSQAARPPAAPAASWGEPLPDRAARAIVFARLANFVEGHAGVSPPVAEAVAAMLDGGALPEIPTAGQGGAGEILSLSHLFLPLARSLDLAEKDALCLVNGSPAAAGLTADAALAARARLDMAAEVIALAFEAFAAPLGHLAEPLESYWNNPHDAWALKRLRALLDGGPTGSRRPYQAPVSFRIAPRMLGQANLAASMAETVAEQSLAAVTDNPVLLPPDAEHPNGAVVSTGGYHNAQAPMAMDGLTASCANLCVIASRLSAKLLDPAVSLRDEMIGGAGDRPYLGCLPMAATGYEEEARGLAVATLLPGSESGGFGQNDVASPVFLAWRKQERAGVLLERALASLALIAVQVLDADGKRTPPALAPLASLARESYDFDDPQAEPGPAAGRLAEALRARVYAA